MKKVFVVYKELTLKQENNFKIQIYNVFLNYNIDNYEPNRLVR